MIREKGIRQDMVKASKVSKAARRRYVKEKMLGYKRNRVTKETAGKYAREVARQRAFLAERGWRKMTSSRFEDFIVEMVEENRLSGATLAHHRSAWLRERAVHGKKRPSKRSMESINLAIEGIRYKAGECPGIPRGAMDSGMLMQLRYHCVVNGCVMEADGFAACWYGMVRHGVMKKAVVADIRRWAAKGPLWHCPRKKALSCKRIKSENLSHFKEVSNLAPLFKIITKGKRSGDKLFPNWCPDRARQLIREAAEVFDWDATVDWSGPHTMRNGASQEGRATLTDEVGSVMKRAVWSSISTAVRYRKLRGEKARKGVRRLPP